MPILSALGQLCREPNGQQLIKLLNQHAPTWLVQMPTLLSATELEAVQRKTQGATQGRMLREFAEAVEILTVEKLLVLVLEDLHWGDVPTLDLLSFLAQRRQLARLLVIGSYRPMEVLARKRPLEGIKQDLQLRGQCQELTLDFLSEAAVAEYLAVRLSVPWKGQDGEALRQEHDRRSPHPVPLLRRERGPIAVETGQEFARVIHRRTEGSPLFIVNLVDYLVAQGAIVRQDDPWVVQRGLQAIEAGVPQSLR